MKGLVAGILVLGLVVVPASAFAHHAGHFRGGFAAGAVTGALAGQALAPRVYYAPPIVHHPAPAHVLGPVYYPAATCWDYWVNGFWYYGSWVGGHWERFCR